jgi:site-specific DNA recombinase
MMPERRVINRTLVVEKVEVRETGIDMELKTNGLTTLITELAGLACEVNERRAIR